VVADEPRDARTDAPRAENPKIKFGERHLHHRPIHAPQKYDGDEQEELTWWQQVALSLNG
jgi:hypothetical protein